MNIGNGFKAIINVIFWIWIVLAVFFIGLALSTWSAGQILASIIFGIGLPVLIRYVFFYVINSFK
jgi:hypothetical protein